jgi:DNA-binding NtrC family response regulator
MNKLKSDPAAEAYTRKVLVVDDEPFCLRAIARILASKYEVVTASGRQEALALARDTHFSLILSDFEMPGGDGLCVVAELRARGQTAPAVLVTGAAVSARMSDAVATGLIETIIHKPFDSESLMAHASRLIERGPSSQPFDADATDESPVSHTALSDKG